MQLAWIDPHTDYPALDLEHLRRNGVFYERLELDDDAYLGTLEQLQRERGYIEQDVVELQPDTPNLDAICAKFADEHLHTDDEVRFVLAGAGVFDIRDDADRWMRVTVEPGDLIVVPKGRHHRFFLTDSKQIRCVRLFQDRAGWVPHYR
ncbi:MAG TPA: cupin domain-containing protein [Enhygromyxa sp.]|nr:cupin domain-containing protein [Enhygromyxa sp.]